MIQNIFVRHIPNILSTSRLLLCYIGMHLFAQEQYWGTIALLFVGWMTDFFDGRIARHLKVQSKLGRWIDHAADRISLFCIYYILYPLNPVFLFLALPGILNSVIQILFAVQLKDEVKVTQADRIWFLTATLIFPTLVIVQLAFGLIELPILKHMQFMIMLGGIILGSISIVQYIHQYKEKIGYPRTL